MKKKDISQYFSNGKNYPSINVKVRKLVGGDISAEELKCSEETREKALEFAFETQQKQFWDEAQFLAEVCLERNVKVYSEGRSGGHLIVEGLPDIDEWDAVMCGRWFKFVKAIEEDIKWRCSKETLLEDILSNRWNEEGAEKYNFFDAEDGQTVCISEMKKKAIEVGFECIIRK